MKGFDLFKVTSLLFKLLNVFSAMSLGSPQLTIVIEPEIMVVSHVGC